MNKTLHRASLLSLALATALGISSAEAAERTWSYTYNSLGLLETADGPRTDVTDVTTYGYDPQGNLTTVTNALGHVTILSDFEANGRPQTATDANGVVSSLTYTPQGWLKSVSVAGSVTAFEHDAVGQITKVTRGDGSFLIYTWDGARRLKRIDNNLGEHIEYDVDPMGNRTAQRISDASAVLTQQQKWVYDELGRLLKSIGQVGSTEQTHEQRYDLNDNPSGQTNARQYSSSQAYDALNRLVASTDTGNGVTTFGYDAQDNLAEVKDPRGALTTYTHNGLGDLTRQVSADTNSTGFVYDAAGNLTKKTDARKAVTQYRYDALNRLIARTYPANPALNVQYHYDMTADGNKGIGRLTAIQDASGVLGYHYDARGNLVEQIRSVPVQNVDQYDRLALNYDNANQLIRLDYPNFSVSYPRNAAGQVSAVTLSLGDDAPHVLAEQLSYQPFGPLKSLTWGNGLTLTRSFDQSYRLTGQQVGAWHSEYAFDANGNITGLDQSLWGELQYDYDALDRLNLEQTSSEKKTYTYDANGNRTARFTYSLADGQETQTAKQSLKYNTNRNRLSQRSTSYAVEVDVAGNYTRYSQNRRYTYDEQGSLSTSSDANGVLMATYRYNALGQRVLKILPNGASWTYLYGPDGQLLGQEQYSSSNGRKLKGQYWIWLDAMPLAGLELSFNSSGAVSSSNLYYLHADHLNTPRLASNQNQALIWSWNSDAFGVGKANQDVDGDGVQTDIPLRFPGQQYDAHTALNYNYFRDYDPETGRYVESDPIGLEGGLNTYGYVHGNPVRHTDPMGLQVATAGEVLKVALPSVGSVCAAAGGGACAAAAVGAVGVGSFILTDTYINPWLQPLITAAVEACTKDNTDDCDKEWEHAYAYCEKLIQSGNNNWREVGKRPPTLQSCAMGYVSQRCGGNRVN